MKNQEAPPTKKVYEDNHVSRIERAHAQILVEASFERYKGTSILTRLGGIREDIFAEYEDVLGDAPSEFRSKPVSNSIIEFPEARFAKETLLPGFVSVVDTLYAECLREPNETLRVAKVERLSAVVFSMGILIHPYIDGNGQTLRLTSMSYLKELAKSKYEDLEFKFRLNSQSSVGQMNGVSVDKLVLLRLAQEERDLETYDALHEFRELVPMGSGAIPFSIEGLKAYAIACRIAGKPIPPAFAYSFVQEQEEALARSISKNTKFQERQLKERLEESTNIRNSYGGLPTMDREGNTPLKTVSHRDEDYYWKIVAYFGKEHPYETHKVTFTNALDILLSEEKRVEERLESLAQTRAEALRTDLENFLAYMLCDEGKQICTDYVRGNLTNRNAHNETEKLVVKMLDNFIEILDDTGPKGVLEPKSKHNVSIVL